MPPSYTDDQIVYAARDGRIAPAQLDRMAQGMIDLINKARAAMSIDGYRFDVDAAETVQVYVAPGKADVAAAGEAGELTKLPDNAMMRMFLIARRKKPPLRGILSVNGLHWNTVRQGQWRVCGQNYAIPPFKGSIHGGGGTFPATTPPDHQRQGRKVIPGPATRPRPSRRPTKHGNGVAA